MLDEGHKAVRAIITGHVQGVFFRDWTVRTASKMALDGWVRNRTDGTVEAMFVGPEETVDQMIEACYGGSPSSNVDNIEITPAQGITQKGFHQKPTVNLAERRN